MARNWIEWNCYLIPNIECSIHPDRHPVKSRCIRIQGVLKVKCHVIAVITHKSATGRAQARLTSDQEVRRQLYYEFQRIFAEDLPALLLYYPLYTYGASTAVHDMEVGRLNEPVDRFRTFAKWYINTRKITRTERRTLDLDKAPE